MGCGASKPAPPKAARPEAVGAVARVQASLAAIANNAELNACAEVLNSSALAQAAQADARTAGPRALEGVPIVVKANIDVAGTLSTASTPGLAQWRPQSTAPVAAKLIEAGAIVVAKTSMPEQALFGMGFSPVHGLTLNPTNRAVTCSGSSSGTAVCIAAGIVRCGLGTDTGGSLRMPADACGIVGFRPSRGRYPSSGVVPADSTRDTVGPMAATAAEVALLDSVITGTPHEEYAPRSLKGLRVAVPADAADPPSAGYKQALELVLGVLRRDGAACSTKAAGPCPAAEAAPRGAQRLTRALPVAARRFHDARGDAHAGERPVQWGARARRLPGGARGVRADARRRARAELSQGHQGVLHRRQHDDAQPAGMPTCAGLP